MPTTDKYKVDGEPVCYSNQTDSASSYHVKTPYRENGNEINGDQYLADYYGMLRAAPIDKYTATKANYVSIHDIAREGTAVVGGTPNLTLYTKDNNDTAYTLQFNHITHTLQIKEGTHSSSSAVTDLKTYSEGVNFAKIWVAATGAGGGGGGNEGAGGGAGGYALFPVIVSNPITITVGGRGDRGNKNNNEGFTGNGGDGSNTILSEYLGAGTGSKRFAYLEGGKGGHYESNADPKPNGGSVSLFGYDSNSALPSNLWLQRLGCKEEHLKCGSAANDSAISSNWSTTYLCRARSGEFGGNGSNDAALDGGSSGESMGHRRDYTFLYNGYGVWSCKGGKGATGTSSAQNDYSSGGGASAFYGSVGGNAVVHADGNNGYLGGGGASGSYEQYTVIPFPTFERYFGGYGGNGCVHIWFGGPGDLHIALGKDDPPDNSSDAWKSGRDVTDYVQITYNNNVSGSTSTHKATFSSSVIPDSKKVILQYSLDTMNQNTGKSAGTRDVNITTTLSYEFTYSSNITEFAGSESKKSAIIA